MPLSPGVRCGAYEIVALLGAGGMGEVYRAHDDKLGRDVAVKIISAEATLNSSAVTRFQQEARAVSALNHPGIVTIHDICDVDGQYFIVMELVEGTTLRELLRRGRPRLKKALQIASQLADALAKAHEVGIVHCDLKPENVMVTSDGQVKIVDFGLAKLAEPGTSGADSTEQASDRTTERLVLGTVGYMSPEQARGTRADFRADHFAFGAILYELTTGMRAFRRPTSVETLAMIVAEQPQSPLAVNATLPSPVVWTIERCLAKDPADRYSSTRDLARDLQTLRDHTSDLDVLEAPRRVTTPGASKRVAYVTLAAVATMAVVAGAAWYLLTRTEQPMTVRSTPAPTFQQLTFKRGVIQNARFAPHRQSIIYAAGWDGGPVRLFETRLSGPESRPVGPPSAGLASISSTGDVALLQGCRLNWGNCVGTLATMPLSGGAPRALLEDVVSADWTPDGKSLAAIQISAGEYQLQFPIGKALYTTAGKLDWLTFSPRGDRLAFIEYPSLSEEGGALKVIDLQGHATTVSSGWRTIRGVAWPESGDEIFLTASDRMLCRLYAVSLTGARRLIYQAPDDVMLMDLSDDRRAIVTTSIPRTHMIWTSGRETRDLSWFDWSTAADLSADGGTVLFYEWGEGVTGPVVYTRNIDGSDAVRLGPGKALALSPDGRWALALQETDHMQLVLLPTGVGEIKTLPAQGLTDLFWARWFPDGRRLLVVASDHERVPRSYIFEADTGNVSQIGEKGMLAVLASPDGQKILFADPLGPHVLWPLDGGKPVEVAGLGPEDRPIQWSGDGKFLYLRGSEESGVLRIERYNLATRKRSLWKELAPLDTAGLIGLGAGRGELAMTPDGKGFVFTYWTALRSLFLGEVLR